MGNQKQGNRRQCPDCSVTLTRYEWSRLWWMSSMMSGRLVQPCTECGARLRLSAMALLSTISALGLIGTSILYLVYRDSTLLYIALVLTLLMLVAMLSTRLEKVPSAMLAESVPQPPRAQL